MSLRNGEAKANAARVGAIQPAENPSLIILMQGEDEDENKEGKERFEFPTERRAGD